ncbi:hypothetical protein FNV43_RR26443 [Rhamnella rubrinervis]|uniref:Uncharacterized protein n=1 Tax=Rhamnella rubrinervis TaxID=2594499 RepID=A0A8K0GRI4_9ROSA|nr:hypothetical protein FNV43_RR26443 [Rhamnella rubrinervis]
MLRHSPGYPVYNMRHPHQFSRCLQDTWPRSVARFTSVFHLTIRKDSANLVIVFHEELFRVEILLHLRCGLTIPMVPTMTFLLFVISEDARIPIPNILHYNRSRMTPSTKNNKGQPRYYTKLAHNLNPGVHSQDLEGMINELREDFANMRSDFGLQLA